VRVLGFRRPKGGLEGRPAGRNLDGDGDDVAGHGITGGGEEANLGLGEVGGVRVPAAWARKRGGG
jgi:hypothetical protein